MKNAQCLAQWLACLPANWQVWGSIPGLGPQGVPALSKSDKDKTERLSAHPVLCHKRMGQQTLARQNTQEKSFDTRGTEFKLTCIKGVVFSSFLKKSLSLNLGVYDPASLPVLFFFVGGVGEV